MCSPKSLFFQNLQDEMSDAFSQMSACSIVSCIHSYEQIWPVTSEKTEVAVINGDSVRLNTGPSAQAPLLLTTSELCLTERVLLILSVMNWKATFCAKFCLRSENRRYDHDLGSPCMCHSNEFHRPRRDTNCLEERWRNISRPCFSVSWILWMASGPFLKERGLSVSPIHNEWLANN